MILERCRSESPIDDFLFSARVVVAGVGGTSGAGVLPFLQGLRGFASPWAAVCSVASFPSWVDSHGGLFRFLPLSWPRLSGRELARLLQGGPV